MGIYVQREPIRYFDSLDWIGYDPWRHRARTGLHGKVAFGLNPESTGPVITSPTLFSFRPSPRRFRVPAHRLKPRAAAIRRTRIAVIGPSTADVFQAERSVEPLRRYQLK